MSRRSDTVDNIEQAIAMPGDDNVEQAIAIPAGRTLMQLLENMGPARQNMQVVEPIVDALPFTHHVVSNS